MLGFENTSKWFYIKKKKKDMIWRKILGILVERKGPVS